MSAGESSRNPDPATRRYPRFFTPDLTRERPSVTLSASESRHALQVLRLEAGAEMELFNGAGGSAHGMLASVERRTCRVAVTEYRESAPPDGVRLRLALARGATQDWVIEKAVELGARGIVWFESERSVARMPEGRDAARRLERWREQVIAAAKQCGADWLPDIRVADGLAAALKADAGGPAWVADWSPDARAIWEIFRSSAVHAPAVYVGPEGGWSDAERGQFRSAGVQPAHLGPLVLRAETAAEFVLAAWRCC